MAWRVGVDIGGAFTDVAVIHEATGRPSLAKVSTTPHDFGEDVIDGLKQAIAVCHLFSFLNDAHETEIGRRLRAAFLEKSVFLAIAKARCWKSGPRCCQGCKSGLALELCFFRQ